MPDSPDQIIRKLQQENKNLKKILKQKDKKLEQKDEELNLERRLWNSREAGWDSGASVDLHRIEVFDGVISDESSLHSATLCSREEFRYILERTGACAIASGDMPLFRDDESRMSDPGNRCKLRFRHALLMSLMCSREEFRYILERTGACAIASGDMPLFRDDESRMSDPGNRCKLRFRHALLMSLIRKKDNPTQGTLQAIFGVDQTSVCRYLKVMDRILVAVLPTARNVSKEIAACKTKEEFKRIVPGPGGGDVTADGTHCSVQRPSEKTIRRMIYSGKKKRFTYNTNVYTNADGVVIGISRSSVGSTGDITLLREDPMPFGRWTESMRDGSTPEEDRIRVWADRGYQGTGKDLPGATLMIPHKRSKNHRILTAEQKEHNHLVNSTRVRVEHSIGRLKRYARLADPYDGTISQFNHEFNVITGLVNLHLLWDKIDKGPPSPGRWGTSIDWSGAVPPANGAPF